ncbi:MAG: hypothetical protein H7Y10_15400 [Flavobacterium sp.]|nr:hypothetical protein [Flavobacterium sp.]
MSIYKKIFLFLIIFSVISCGKNKENEEHELEQKNEPHYEQETTAAPDPQKNEITYESPEDSIRAVKNSILRKQNIKKKEQTEKNTETSDDKSMETSETTIPSDKPTIKKAKAPSFVYIKKILHECQIGVPMTQKDLQANYNIPEEAIQLVKSVTKISENELDIKWKSTWLIEKMSDAKFNDGILKVRFEKNKMYTSGGAISIKYEKKMYTDLYLIGRSAYIPTVKGYYWQIGK